MGEDKIQRPRKIAATERIRPEFVATWIPFRWLPVKFHTRALRINPPSRFSTCNKLNNPRIKLRAPICPHKFPSNGLI